MVRKKRHAKMIFFFFSESKSLHKSLKLGLQRQKERGSRTLGRFKREREKERAIKPKTKG